jgi:hypothetical protein
MEIAIALDEYCEAKDDASHIDALLRGMPGPRNSQYREKTLAWKMEIRLALAYHTHTAVP